MNRSGNGNEAQVDGRVEKNRRKSIGPQHRAPLIVHGITVDVVALLRLAHECRPGKCRSPRSCCEHYEVSVDGRELDSIIGHLPAAAKLIPSLRESNGYASFYEPAEDGRFSLETHENGRCVFAYRGRRGETLCALHSAALAQELSPYAVKPRACSLWPLALSDDGRSLGVQDDVYLFACNRKRRPGARQLHRGVADILRESFGEPFLLTLVARLTEHRPKSRGKTMSA